MYMDQVQLQIERLKKGIHVGQEVHRGIITTVGVVGHVDEEVVAVHPLSGGCSRKVGAEVVDRKIGSSCCIVPRDA
jgi:hypothetical protein